MRILASADLHNDTTLAEKLASKAVKENVDLVVLCGDIGHFHQVPKNILGPFAKAGKKVLLIPGNHDSFATADFLAEVYGATNLHGYTAVYEDVGFFGCGGANMGLEALDEEEIYDILAKGHKKLQELSTRILVSHVHPSASVMDTMSPFVAGSSGLRKAIEKLQPQVVLCGHVHEASGIEEKIGNTRVINVSRTGKILDL